MKKIENPIKDWQNGCRCNFSLKYTQVFSSNFPKKVLFNLLLKTESVRHVVYLDLERPVHSAGMIV